AHAGHHAQPVEEPVVAHQTGFRTNVVAANRRVGIPRRCMTDPFEATGCGGEMGGQHLLHVRTEPEVGEPDDPGHDGPAAWTEIGARARHVLGLADGTQTGGATGAISAEALNEDALDDAMASPGLGAPLVHAIP